MSVCDAMCYLCRRRRTRAQSRAWTCCASSTSPRRPPSRTAWTRRRPGRRGASATCSSSTWAAVRAHSLRLLEDLLVCMGVCQQVSVDGLSWESMLTAEFMAAWQTRRMRSVLVYYAAGSARAQPPRVFQLLPANLLNRAPLHATVFYIYGSPRNDNTPAWHSHMHPAHWLGHRAATVCKLCPRHAVACARLRLRTHCGPQAALCADRGSVECASQHMRMIRIAWHVVQSASSPDL